ncbi:MAG: hypothetical protein CL912_21075 [Deltaproteobacteria bacterium]|nr:hypothetical protein [Deltaproteobacteria bacterium]
MMTMNTMEASNTRANNTRANLLESRVASCQMRLLPEALLAVVIERRSRRQDRSTRKLMKKLTDLTDSGLGSAMLFTLRFTRCNC